MRLASPPGLPAGDRVGWLYGQSPFVKTSYNGYAMVRPRWWCTCSKVDPVADRPNFRPTSINLTKFGQIFAKAPRNRLE